MVSVATTAAMDLTHVVPALMQGVAQEVGMELSELKLIVVGSENQFDPKPFQQLMAQDDKVDWDFAPCDPHHNPEPYLEILN